MENTIIKIKEPRSVRFRTICWTNDLDDFKEKTYRSRKYFFRNIYLIQETTPGVFGTVESKYLEVRTIKKVYRCYMDGRIF